MPHPFQQVTDELRSQITAGEYKPGQFLPSGRVLAQRFGVARDTVALGVAVLVEEGLVLSLPKRGYQVLAAATAFEAVWTQDGRLLPAGQSHLGAGEDLRVEVRRAPAAVADLLHGPADMSVVVRSTVHRHAGAPWALREFFVPQSVADVARRLTSPEPVDEVRLLAEHDLGETGQRSRWSTRPATADETRLLMSGSAPVHSIQRTGFHDGDSVFCEVTVVRADRIFLSRLSGSIPDDPESTAV